MTTRKPPARPAARPRADTAPPRPTGKRPTGRRRMNLMVDPALLQQASASLGTTNMSEVVNVALRKVAEDDAIVAGVDALFGAFPHLPGDEGEGR